MRRREFVAGLLAVVSPRVARAQTSQRVRRIGVLMGWSESDPRYGPWIDALRRGLAALGWVAGRNVQLDVQWSNGNVERAQALARMLVEQQPDVLFAGTTPAAAALHRETRTIPIVFALVADPVGAGFVASLARPGGNMTGFINIEAAMGGKWVVLLKEAVPGLRRVARMFNPDTAPGEGTFYQAAFEAAAKTLMLETTTTPVRSDAEIEAAIAALGRDHAGLVLSSDSFTNVHRATIVAAAVRHTVPFISNSATMPREGGLMGYGPDTPDIFRRSAAHVDRVLRGANPSDLPVEVPTKFVLVINTRAAAALGLMLAPSLLARADEVIE